METGSALEPHQGGSPAPEPVAGVGIHHSSPRAAWMYSGQRKSIGGAKSFGNSGATHCVQPMPPPVRSVNSSCARFKRAGSVSRSRKVAAIVLAPRKIPGLIAAGRPPSALWAQAGYS